MALARSWYLQHARIRALTFRGADKSRKKACTRVGLLVPRTYSARPKNYINDFQRAKKCNKISFDSDLIQAGTKSVM